MILPTLEKIFAAVEAMRLQAQGYQKKTIAPLKIGLVPSVSAALITELLLELARVIPDLESIYERRMPTGSLQCFWMAGSMPHLSVTPWSYLSVSTVGCCSRSGACSSCLGNIRWRGKPLSRSKTCMRRYFSKGSDATWQDNSSRLVLPTIQALKLCTGALRKGTFSKWHPPVLGPSWRQSTLPGCRRSPLFQLRATPSGARCSFLAVAGRQYSPALDAFIKVARVRDWTSALDKLRHASAPAWRQGRCFAARLTHKVPTS